MTLTCRRCGIIFDSLIIDGNLALQEVTNRLVMHCSHKHPQVTEILKTAIVKANLAVGGMLTLTELASISDDEKFINAKLDECQEIIMAAAGFTKNDPKISEVVSNEVS